MYALLSSTLALFLAAAPLAAVAPAAPHAALVAQTQQEQAEVKPVDINTASAEELQKVPGIGEALARRIVEFREENGRFEKVDDLLNVRGIGVTSLEKLRPYLSVKQTG
ncbi:MAG: helix-hairpin-helix domain-containing protein [Acidobacteriota bacterium]|jgi:competence protein ComEA